MKINSGVPVDENFLPKNPSRSQETSHLTAEEKIFIEVSQVFEHALSQLYNCQDGLKYLSDFLQTPEVYGSSLSNDVKATLDDIDSKKVDLHRLSDKISSLHTRMHKKMQRIVRPEKFKIIRELLK